MASNYGISLKDLRELMEHRGAEGIDKIKGLGGVNELCKRLKTSPQAGKTRKKIARFSLYPRKNPDKSDPC